MAEYRTEAEIEEIPEAVARLTGNIWRHLDEIAKLVDERGVKRVFLLGCGSSYNAAYISSYSFKKTGLEVYPKTSGGFLVSQPRLSETDMVLGFSRSGETSETLWALEKARSEGSLTVAVTNTPTSSMAKISDLSIPVYAGVEESVVMTKTFVNLSLTGVLVGCKITGKVNLLSEAQKLERVASATLEASRRVEDRMVNLLAHSTRAYCIGEGVCYGSARESAIKLIETARILASPFHAMEFRHGPISLADEVPIIAIALEGEAQSYVEKLVEDAGRISVSIILATNIEGLTSESSYVYRLPSGIDEILLAPIAVIPLQRLAYRIALEKGLNPDKPKHLSKYVKL